MVKRTATGCLEGEDREIVDAEPKSVFCHGNDQLKMVNCILIINKRSKSLFSTRLFGMRRNYCACPMIKEPFSCCVDVHWMYSMQKVRQPVSAPGLILEIVESVYRGFIRLVENDKKQILIASESGSAHRERWVEWFSHGAGLTDSQWFLEYQHYTPFICPWTFQVTNV